MIICLAFFLTLSGGGQAALAKAKFHKMKEKTKWTVVSVVPGVHHTVFAGKEVFRYQDRYYWYDGRWHQGNHYGGPWVAIAAPPPVIYRVERVYLKKVPPGWCKGKKTGWPEAPLPPGHVKGFH